MLQTQSMGLGNWSGIRRSLGAKLIVLAVLGLALGVVSFFIQGLVEDRQARQADVRREIGSDVGGSQVILGTVLSVPYSVAATKTSIEQHGIYWFFPKNAEAAIRLTTEERRRSLFRVPVYRAELDLKGDFDLTSTPTAAPAGAVLDWSRARVVVGISDSRGALSNVALSVGGKSVEMAPEDSPLETGSDGKQSDAMRLTLFGAPFDQAGSGWRFTAESRFTVSGAERIAVLAFGKATQVHMAGDWPSPGFEGGFLPVKRTLGSSGFQADWLVPYVARGVRDQGVASAVTGLGETAMGAQLVEVADPYQSVSRAVKYALLFVGLVFLTYFVFEVTAGKRVHLAQYLLVGIAQLIFYLLLLSLAERMGFDWAYLLAGSATVLLLSLNAMWIFSAIGQGLRALGVFGMLYALIYLMLRLEDNALLVGALASFTLVAVTMYLTRRIDWYGGGSDGQKSQPA